MGKDALLRFVETLDIWAVVFALIVAVGVGGEFVVGYLHWTKGKRLRSIEAAENAELQARAAAAQAEAAAAVKSAAEANATAKQFESQIAEANARTKEAEAELARIKAPRMWTAENRGKFIALTKEFSGTLFDVYVNNDKESIRFMYSIIEALKAGGWRQVPAKEPILFDDLAAFLPIGGIHIEIYHGETSRFKKPFDALGQAFVATGFSVEGHINPKNTRNDSVLQGVALILRS